MSLLKKFYIKDKTARKVKFLPKKAQLDFLKKRTGRDYILKARQMGFTTLGVLRQLEKVLLYDNTTCAIMAPDQSKLNDIFKIGKYAWDNLTDEMKAVYRVKYDNIRELDFDTDSINSGSRFFVSGDLRSGTVQDLHISEFSLVKDVEETFASSLEAVPKTGSITLETTARGLGKSHEIWQEAVAGKNEFTPHFYNWTWDEEYWEKPPENNDWKEWYKEIASKENLILDIQKQFKLSDAQFYWYFLKARRLGAIIKQEYPTTPEEAFLTSSTSVFDLFKVSQLTPQAPESRFKGVEIYAEPKATHRYIIGVDTAEGGGGDSTSIEVLDVTNSKFEQVASFNDNTIRPDQSAKLAMELGKKYNNAFIIPERNSSGLTTVLGIVNAGYKRIFREDMINDSGHYGWRTSSTNRDTMIDDFVEAFEEGNLIINSPTTIAQMKTFVRKENGKREHDTGYNDDSLFGLFLAVQGRKYLSEIEENRERVYPIGRSQIITESIPLKNICIGVDYLPNELVYEVFGVDWANNRVVGVAEGNGSFEDLRGLVADLKSKGHTVSMFGVGVESKSLAIKLRTLGLKGTIVKSPVQKGVDRIRSLISAERLVLGENQVRLLEEIEEYAFNPEKLKKGETQPLIGYRYVEAMRFALMGMWGIVGRLAREVLQSGEDSAIMNEEILS